MEPDEALVYLTSVVGNFQGRLLVARLAAEGIESALRGASDGPYPMTTEIEVLVPASSLAIAREVLLADAIDAAFIEREEGESGRVKRRRFFKKRESP